MSNFDLAALAPTHTPAEARVCRCGCNTPVGARASYRPGHDARHAGAVSRALVAATDPTEAQRLLATLPSAALQRKALDQALAARKRADAQAKVEAPAPTDAPAPAPAKAKAPVKA